MLLQVTTEIEIIGAEHEIKVDINLKEDFECDINMICQLYGNLLGNAVKHGSTTEAIKTEICADNGFFSLAVSNSGKKIPDEELQNLFKSFFSTNSPNNSSGLGLGLYISSEIAKAHNGKIMVNSGEGRTVFEFVMPINTLK